MLKRTFVWDIFIRIFHWSLVICFIANAFFTNPEKATHHIVGYCVAFLIGFRLVWGFIGSPHARFKNFPISASSSLEQAKEMLSGQTQVHAGHSPLGALMIYNFILTFIGIVITGYAMTTLYFFGVAWVEDTHRLLVTWAEISVALHIAAVFFESHRLKINLIASMLTGHKNIS